jgi:hypothetical protein
VETVNLGCNIVMIYDPLVMHYGTSMIDLVATSGAHLGILGTIRSITVWPICECSLEDRYLL